MQSSRLNLPQSPVALSLVQFVRRWAARPPAVLAIYILALYVALSTLYSFILGLQARLAGADWLAAGDTNDPFYEMGTSLGFWGMLFFGLNFLLATRWQWIERLFGGLDKVYQLHAFVGKATLTMVVLHMAILVVQALPDWSLVTTYTIPGVDIDYTTGLLGVVGLTVLVLLTIWAKLNYHTWFQSHKWMGVPYVLGGLHAILLQGDWYMIVLTAVGGYAWLYNLFFYRRVAPQSSGRLLHNVLKGDVNELLIRLDKALPLRPGQFVFLSVAESAYPMPKDQHPFSLSQIVDLSTLRISAKTLGDYTAQLRHLAVGDKVSIHGPHGVFGDRSQEAETDLLWIAGGIGITPFLSMLHAEAATGTPRRRNIRLIWGVRGDADAVYDEEIRQLVSGLPHVTYHLHHGRLSYDVLAGYVGAEALATSTVFMCGPVPMMHALTDQFLAHGKSPREIVSEEFALR